MKKAILIMLLFMFSCSHQIAIRKIVSTREKRISYPVTKTIRYASSLRIVKRDGEYILVKKKPVLSWKEAHELAIIIYKYSREYNVDWKLMIAVFRQESDFNIKARNKSKIGLREKTSAEIEEDRKLCFDKYQKQLNKILEEMKDGTEEEAADEARKQEAEIRKLTEQCLENIQYCVRDILYFDFGIGQINHTNLDRFKFNLNKIRNDLDYSVWAAFKIMREKKRYEKREPENWWTRYNAKGLSLNKRQEYYDDVMRFYYDIYEDENIK